MPYSYKLNVFLTQTGVVLFFNVAHLVPPPPPPPLPTPTPRDDQIPPLGSLYSLGYGIAFVYRPNRQ